MRDDGWLLSMRGVEKKFGATHALKGVSLSLRRGEVLALIGENGAGKSTLMKVLSGAHPADAGEMRLEGAVYRPRDPLAARRAGVAMIYQELSIAPHLTVAENIVLGVEPGAAGLYDRGRARTEARRALAEVGRPDIDPSTKAGSLGIAEQQLVEIARSVALGAKVLVLDEPTSSLTRRDIESLFAMLRRLRAAGMGIVYISHFLEEVRAISDRFAVLRDGSSVGEGVTAEVSNEQIIRLMVGREVADLYPRRPHVPGEVVLEVGALASGRGKPTNASLSLRRGEVLGIAGLVGAGRTELLRAVFGLDTVKSGQVRVAGFSGHATPARRWGQSVGMLSEDRKNEGLAVGLSIADNVTLTRLSGLGPLGLVLPARQGAATVPWIKRLSIKCHSPRQAVRELSGGNQQKAALGRLMHHDVDVLLLDEPTRGVDIGAKSEIYRLIDELAVGDAGTAKPGGGGGGEGVGGRRPRAVLVVSSYLPELMGICDRIAVMSRGVLEEARPVSEWDEHRLMAEAVGGEASD